METKREVWVDDVKSIACMLVVLGHFFQSMTRANVLPTNALYLWFNQTIYLFHVPLFFICSGYLYQKINYVDSIDSWIYNIKRKVIELGVPYFVFSIITWLFKALFANSVNNKAGHSLFGILFLNPMSPYWYLYALFFLFLITPTFKTRKKAFVYVMIFLAAKIIYLLFGGTSVYVISTLMQNGIWFVLGMIISFNKFDLSTIRVRQGWMLGIVFLISSIVWYIFKFNIPGISFVLGLIACVSIISLVYNWDKNGSRKIFSLLPKYTMPIFLMHTLFAAGIRSILLKFALSNPLIHFIFGIAFSFLGPMLVAKVIRNIPYFNFFLYPGKYVHISRARREQN